MITSVPLYLAGDMTINGAVPTAVVTQRHNYVIIQQDMSNNNKTKNTAQFGGSLSQIHVQWGV